jgi:hypothetical protein
MELVLVLRETAPSLWVTLQLQARLIASQLEQAAAPEETTQWQLVSTLKQPAFNLSLSATTLRVREGLDVLLGTLPLPVKSEAPRLVRVPCPRGRVAPLLSVQIPKPQQIKRWLSGKMQSQVLMRAQWLAQTPRAQESTQPLLVLARIAIPMGQLLERGQVRLARGHLQLG